MSTSGREADAFRIVRVADPRERIRDARDKFSCAAAEHGEDTSAVLGRRGQAELHEDARHVPRLRGA